MVYLSDHFVAARKLNDFWRRDSRHLKRIAMVKNLDGSNFECVWRTINKIEFTGEKNKIPSHGEQT